MDKYDKSVSFTYENGKMSINLKEFFPCELWRIKKLLKVIDLIVFWDDRKKVTCEILTWTKDYLSYLDDQDIFKKLANEAVDSRTWAKEQQADIDKLQDKVKSHIESVRHLKKGSLEYERSAENLQNEKDLLKTLKFTQKESLKNAKYCEQKIETRKKQVEKLKKNIEILQSAVDLYN